ncbi:hypothetical protein ACFSTC_01400 [Nonomuraea ferruginea]
MASPSRRDTATPPPWLSQLLEEGDRSPADAFFAQDAGALGAVAKKGMFAPLPDDLTGKVPETYRA